MALKGTTEDGCTPTARVVVGDTEVPWVSGNEGEGGVEVQTRKTGPSDITRFSDITIPYTWGGDDVLSAITTPSRLPDVDGLRSFGNAPVRIDIRDTETEEYITAHHGPITNSGAAQLDNCFTIHVTDWANYLERIGTNIGFTKPTLDQVLTYVTDTATANHGGIDDMGYEIVVDGQRTEPNSDEITTLTSNFYENVEEGEVTVGASKNFNDFEHSLVDVINWATSIGEIRWYVEYDAANDRPTLVYNFEPTAPSFDGLPLDNSTSSRPIARVIKNNALYQISPIRTLGVRGNKNNRGVLGIDGKKAPEVIVEHSELAERSGSNENPRFEDVDTTSLEATEKTAKSLLKDRIDSAGGGEMICRPFGFAQPYATIDSKPTCGQRIARDLDTITYEIEEVIHDIAASTQQHDGPKTILRCGVEVGEGDIVIKESQNIDI